MPELPPRRPLLGLSREYDEEYPQGRNSETYEPDQDQQAGSKRKRAPSTAPRERKKVTRACDSCKAKKVRCSGTQPCNRCTAGSLRCRYNAEHRRGRPPCPESSVPRNANEQAEISLSTPQHQVDQRQCFRSPISELPREATPSPQLRKSLSSHHETPEADQTRFASGYIGPTSGIAFLRRAQGRFQQDLFGSMSNSFDGQGSLQTPVRAFGDGWFPDYSTAELVFPTRSQANHLLDRYFDFSMPTYRFLHRATVEGWLQNFCEETESTGQLGQNLSSAKSAIVLLILATAKLYGEEDTSKDDPGILNNETTQDMEQSGILFAAAERHLSRETGPVTLESVQARLAQCIYLLASSRINQAWYTFGTATQMILALGLHRNKFPQSSGAAPGPIRIECRKRVFWSAYTLDRYLSVILGRPRIFRDEDVDQQLPDRLNDADLTTTSANMNSRSTYNQCVSDGPIYHARLAKIIGGISSDLYPTNRKEGMAWSESAQRWTAELKAWKESLPAFLEPAKVDPSMLIPIFQRQSTVLRLAYAHALILANRSSILNNFADLSRRQDLLEEGLEGSLKECIDAAMLVVETVNRFIHEGKLSRAFWLTSYISFCAIATLYVYAIQQSISRQPDNLPPGSEVRKDLYIQHFEAAEKCQRRIAQTTSKTSLFRRYNIILDELRKEVLHQLGGPPYRQANEENRPTEHHILLEGERVDSIARPQEGTLPTTPTNKGQSYSLDFDMANGPSNIQVNGPLQLQSYVQPTPPYDFRPAYNPPGQTFYSSILDLTPFDPQGENIGWSEFDSCAITWPEGLATFYQGGGS